MSHEKSYTSKDFGLVPNKLTASLPNKLIHKSVIQENSKKNTFDMERGHPVHIVDLPSKTLSMTIGILAPKAKTQMHRHNYETVIYITHGFGHSVIEDQLIEWTAGDAIYVPIWSWHQHVNLSEVQCEYIACENAPLLQNLGNIALREEVSHDEITTL